MSSNCALIDDEDTHAQPRRVFRTCCFRLKLNHRLLELELQDDDCDAAVKTFHLRETVRLNKRVLLLLSDRVVAGREDAFNCRVQLKFFVSF